MPVRVLKSVATVVGIAAILALVTFVARVLARDSAPQSEEEPAGAQSATPNDEPLPVSTIPTPFGMDDFDARALFVADDDTVDASAQFGASLQTDGGRSDSGAPPRDGGPK